MHVAYTCTHACMHACMHACIRTYIHDACIHAHTHACTYIRTHTRMHVCMHTCICHVRYICYAMCIYYVCGRLVHQRNTCQNEKRVALKSLFVFRSDVVKTIKRFDVSSYFYTYITKPRTTVSIRFSVFLWQILKCVPFSFPNNFVYNETRKDGKHTHRDNGWMKVAVSHGIVSSW